MNPMLNLEQFATALKEAEHEAILRTIYRDANDYTVTFVTKDGCSRTTKFRWDDGPPSELKLPIWPEGARRAQGERTYQLVPAAKNTRELTYREGDAPKPPRTKRPFLQWMDIYRDSFFNDRLWFDEPKPHPTFGPKPDDQPLITLPTPKEVHEYTLHSLSGGGRTHQVIDDIIGVPNRDMWGRIHITPGMLKPPHANE